MVNAYNLYKAQKDVYESLSASEDDVKKDLKSKIETLKNSSAYESTATAAEKTEIETLLTKLNKVGS